MGIDVRCLLTRTGKHYFNPRSPDGERLVDFRTVGLRLEISIHAPPRMGSDNGMGAVFNWLYLFQSTLPGGGATTSRTSSSTPSAGFQSTLPGWGATKPIQGDRQNRKDFNPRSPDGERHGDVANVTVTDVFQSTLPGWGATGRIGTWVWTIIFQSTLPGWGATQSIVNQSI